MKGMIGLSGTTSRPFAIVILAPPTGAVIFVVVAVDMLDPVRNYPVQVSPAGPEC
jgi:hypothetical protein